MLTAVDSLPLDCPRHIDAQAAALTDEHRGSAPVAAQLPIEPRVVVRRVVDAGDEKVGSIIVPDNAREKPQRGTVVAAGRGTVTDDGVRVPLDVTPGDLVVFANYAGQEVTSHDEDLLIVRENEILAILDPPVAAPAKD